MSNLCSIAAPTTSSLLHSSSLPDSDRAPLSINCKRHSWKERTHFATSLHTSHPSRIGKISGVVETVEDTFRRDGGEDVINGKIQASACSNEQASTIPEVEEYPLDMEDPCTALQRLFLETQWKLTSRLGFKKQTNPEQEEPITVVVSSGRPAARQRRIQARTAIKNRNSGAQKATSSSSKRGRKKRVLQDRDPHEYANTYGYMRETNRRSLLTAEQEIHLSKIMRVGQNLRLVKAKLAKELGCEPTDDQWALSLKMPIGDLNAKLREADKARDEMFISNVRLVVSVAKHYAKFGVDMNDLIQEGALGLLRGLEKFNHTKGFKLSTYVHWWIHQGVNRALAENARLVRVPVYVHERLNLIRKAKALLQVERATLSVKNISEILDMSDKKVVNALMVTKKTIYLDKVRGSSLDGDEEMHNYVADPVVANNPWATIDKMFMKDDINNLLASTLAPREQDIIRSHYGLDRADGRRLSFDHISKRIGLSRERVRQLENMSLRKLKMSSQTMNLDVLQMIE